MTPTVFAEPRLNGYFEPGFRAAERALIDVFGAPATGVLNGAERPCVPIYDGRRAQAAAAVATRTGTCESSDARFFREHGFVLLRHESAVRDWDSGPVVDPSAGTQPAAHEHNEIETFYLPEVDALIRTRLLPGTRLEISQPAALLRRGPGTANPYYGEVIHNDYGLQADDYEENIAAFGTEQQARAWRQRYEQPDVAGYMVINFWRTVYMNEPLCHMPLAVLDASSVPMQDVVPSGLLGFTPTGKVSNQLSLRLNADHRWHAYPRMTCDEVLALTLFHCMKDDAEPRLRACYHTAFPEPAAPPDAMQRQSCEHRVGVFLLNES